MWHPAPMSTDLIAFQAMVWPQGTYSSQGLQQSPTSSWLP